MRFMHISDLHFSAQMHRNAPSAHSIDLLRGIQKIVETEAPTHVLLSGDITDEGDGQSLVNAREWLFSTVPVGGEERIGLQLKTEQVFFVPGNHDAFNVLGESNALLLRQRSLDNFRREFPYTSYATVGEHDYGCRHFWLKGDDVDIHLCAVDSSYIGDPSKETSGVANLDRAACGRWLREQARTVLSWYDQGIAGKLKMPGESVPIPANAFRQSLKILLMHHYLLDPPVKRSRIRDHYLRIKNKKTVLRNILMADFDLMLCGHKHVLWADDRSYADHLDPRTTNRLLLTIFKRQLGLRSSPMVTDSAGRRMKRALLNGVFMLGSWLRAARKDGIPDLVERHLHDVSEFEQRLKEMFTDSDPEFEQLDNAEVDSIVTALQELPRGDRIELARIATKQLRECKSALGIRKFLHIMSGSSSKRTSIADSRALNVYDITNDEKQISVRYRRYVWGPDPSCTIGAPWTFRLYEKGGERTFHFPHNKYVPA